MAPGQSEILVGPVHILYRQVHGAGIQTQEHMSFFPRPVLELIDLVFDLEGSAKVSGGGKGLVFNTHDHVGVPGMLIEIASNHLPVLRPFVKRIRGAVHSDESLPVPDEVHESLFPFFRNRQLPCGVEHHRIVVLEVLGAD